MFFTLEDVREKLARWQEGYNCARPHSALQDRAPAFLAAEWSAAAPTVHAPQALLETSREPC